ncbi:MAG: DUF748 domain-containing protein [Gammaproteobacteria bacterium]
MTIQSPTGPNKVPDKKSSSGKNIKSLYKHNPWKSRFILIAFSIIILLGIARLALPQTIIYSATSWLKDHDIVATIEDININIFNGTVSLVNAKGNKSGQPLFNVGLIDIHWRWAPLSDKTIVVTKVVLDNLAINIEQYTDEIIVGGVHIPLSTSAQENKKTTDNDEKAKPENTKSWAASLGEVVFTNLNICYLQHTVSSTSASKKTRYIDYCIDLKEMVWGGTISYATDPVLLETNDIPLSSTGHFKLNGLTVTDNRLNKQLLSSSENTLHDVSIKGLNAIHVSKLVMHDLSALQRDDDKHKDSVRFSHLTVSDIKLTNLNSLSINSASLTDPGLFIVKLNDSDWEYARWIPLAPNTPATNKPDQQPDTKSSTFEFVIKNIQVNNSDFCYLEDVTNIYYCFNQDALDWKGSIKTLSGGDNTQLSISGDLVASNTKIHNPKLNRDLLDVKSLSLNKLNITRVNDIFFETLSIDSLSALQRGDKTNDSTASFSKLTINKTGYANNAITIDAIDLIGLSSHVSKNKDGSWEFDKWLTNADAKTRPDDKKTISKNPPADDKPLKISVNKVHIKTEKELLFIDNSTQPAMTVGLNKLEFSIRDLLADKPNTDSPFELSAKTTRHSTIDIAGTVRPFADKISFDAKGKLKGFDLRAASPAARKAIGHSIKSGQMDADLTLLAKEGILDSNIALSLYQFNIKAESKKDAEALNKKFGMPLNQTLVLLRDKDGSIHLDIPITGDINNPDFNPMDAIIKATSKAATVTLITFYTPYGLAYFGGSALFDLATALDFKPILFNPGSADMPEDSAEQLKKMARLLTEKPQVHLTLCGVTNKSDIYALYPELKDQAGKDDKKIVLNEQQQAALEKLAKDRQINSKKYLIEKANIDHDRLILCAPEHSSEDDAVAGVEINI